MTEHKIQNIKHTYAQNSFENKVVSSLNIFTQKKREKIGNERLTTALNHMHKLIPVRL